MMDISVRTICKITGYSKPRVYQIKKAKQILSNRATGTSDLSIAYHIKQDVNALASHCTLQGCKLLESTSILFLPGTEA